jgi:hypothetical protein
MILHNYYCAEQKEETNGQQSKDLFLWNGMIFMSLLHDSKAEFIACGKE